MIQHWSAFTPPLTSLDRHLAIELAHWLNVAESNPLSARDAFRALDTVERLMFDIAGVAGSQLLNESVGQVMHVREHLHTLLISVANELDEISLLDEIS
eukprot:CAMPEP_0175908146 /NCGR_PEP_ID=MMETSP0108-20121206/6440_1 /TAXON_ID=195067 ORGANISM="Goniomonas pacifica, Strain CCMP1869" /NCGR_SAMPLE_ID=MMETSP0108 /ASSEMBLY_ACC=CAM_ASM_000204 /LENGTH=98 /DNA_ID=CAMNT_0017230177 /DNA_START=30 /DNA_END=326 /DNA_ORIENTATION=-